MNTEATSFWRTKRGNTLALVLLGLAFVVLLVANLSELGIWEPWEASALLVATEYHTRAAWDASVIVANPEAPGYNWATPTLMGKPVPFSLLKTWLLELTIPSGLYEGDTRTILGALEARTRLPQTLALLLLTGGLFAWIKQRFSTLQALLCSLLFVCMPAIYFGAHNLSTEVLALASTSGALICFFEATHAKSTRAKSLLALGFALTMCLVVLDWRLTGLLTVLGPIALFAVAQLPFAGDKITLKHLLPSLVIVVLPLLWFGLPMLQEESYALATKATTKPWRLDMLLLLESSALLLGAFVLARRTHVVRTLRSMPMLLAILVPVALLIAIGWSWASVNPTLLRDGEIQGSIPVLQHMFAQFIPQKSLAQGHFHFDLWMRQIGFGAFPVTALIPSGIAYLSLGTRRQESDQEHTQEQKIQAQIKRFALVWAFGSLIVMLPASGYDHYFYLGYLPLALGAGLMLGDLEFWRRSDKTRPLLMGLVGVVAVAVVMTLGKDLERYPYRFLELYTAFEPKLELPKDFSWSRTYKPLKYTLMLGFMTTCFGLLSSAVLMLGSAKRLPTWWGRRKEKHDHVEELETPSILHRHQLKQAMRNPQGNLLEKLLFLLESPQTRGVVIALMMLTASTLFLWRYIPRASHHLSQRVVFNTYTDLTQDAPQTPLLKYMTGNKKASIYLKEAPKIGSSAKFHERFKEKERFFAVIPRNRLAKVNSDVRKQHGKNVPVLNAQSSDLILISNQVAPGEEDKNFIAKHIFDSIPKAMDYPVTYKNKAGEQVTAKLDGALELLGYSLNREKTTKELPLFERGQDLELSIYFRVLKPVPGNQKFFVHIDTPGNRLHGDHYPLGGDFSTMYWNPGDIVRDVHTIKVDSYAKRGVYTLNFGFYIGSKRMKVEPRSAHDGQNRMTLGKIKVQ